MAVHALRRAVGILVAAVLIAWVPALSVAADDPDEAFSIHDPSSAMTVDHKAWARLLATYISTSADGINFFAYGRVSAADKQALKRYLAALQDVKVGALNVDEQRAFWINLYNALTVDVVLDHYPVKTIRNISLGGGLFTIGPWKAQLVTVEGRALSLDNIEHDILRKVWKDPRVHYAVNCASMSCPNLMAKAFTGATLDKMLTQGARDYINHPRGAKVEKGRLRLSEIYSWYRKDFGKSDGEILAHLRLYAGPELKKELEGIETIAGYDYDWSLNEAK